MNKKVLFLFLVPIFLFSLTFTSALGLTQESTTTNVYVINSSEVNLSNLADVDAISPSNNNFLRYNSGTLKWVLYAFQLSDYWDFDYGDLINVPTLLSDFTDDLGDRGYTSVSNFTNDYSFYNSTTLTSVSQLDNDLGYWNDTYATFNKTYADTLYYDLGNSFGYYNSTTLENLTQLTNDLGIGNWTLDKTDYYTISEVENNFTNYFTSLEYYDNATSTFIFQSNEGNLNVNSSGYWDGYDDPTEIKSGDSDLLDAYDSSFFLPLNTSLIGDFNFTGQFDFNGGWTSNGLSVIDGDLYAQTVYAYNFSGLDVTNLNTNGSLYPTMDNQFDLGNGTLRWRDLNLGRNALIDGVLQVDGTGDSYLMGDVGIGTTSPGAKLDVNGTGDSGSLLWTNWQANFGNSATGRVLVGSYENQPAIQGHGTGTSYRLLLNPTGGNVGIGTTSPVGKLNVVGDLNVTGNFINGANIGYTGSCVNVTYSGGIAVSCND